MVAGADALLLLERAAWVVAHPERALPADVGAVRWALVVEPSIVVPHRFQLLKTWLWSRDAEMVRAACRLVRLARGTLLVQMQDTFCLFLRKAVELAQEKENETEETAFEVRRTVLFLAFHSAGPEFAFAEDWDELLACDCGFFDQIVRNVRIFLMNQI